MFRNFIITAALCIGGATPLMATDVCEEYCDYLCRHYRTDLKPIGLKVQTSSVHGIHFATLSVQLQNSGDNVIGSAGNQTNITITVEGLGPRNASFTGVLNPGESVFATVGRVLPSSFPQCSWKEIVIDSDREFGQWGCNVYANDARNLRINASPTGRCIPFNQPGPIRPLP